METMRCERSKEKWNKVKGSIKVHVDCRRREARMTRRGTNKAGEVEDEDILIISSDKEVQYNLYKWGGAWEGEYPNTTPFPGYNYFNKG